MWIMAAAAAAAFNLVCTGTMTVAGGDRDGATPYRTTYRIDLASGKYCEGDCPLLRDIAEVQPSRITLDQRGNPAPGASDYAINVIDRTSGEQTILTSSGRRGALLYVKSTGRCESQPFTGFPAAVTKF
jgi:hypothetical protein